MSLLGWKHGQEETRVLEFVLGCFLYSPKPTLGKALTVLY